MPALVVIDIQNDFCSGGTLAVAGAEAILPVVNQLIEDHEHVVLTQDWHPPGHVSFASSHPPARPFDRIVTARGEQTLWPDHCLAGTRGAEFHPDLAAGDSPAVVRKGTRREADAYSGFFECDGRTPVGLDAILRRLGVREITLAGLATDVCVLHTALDARRLGYGVRLVTAACRGTSCPGSRDALRRMAAAGVNCE